MNGLVRYVILGNHRDAWTFGAVDPNSGTAVLMEIAQRLDKLQKRGWKPRRTIILCNWDAEEYGLVSSLYLTVYMCAFVMLKEAEIWGLMFFFYVDWVNRMGRRK
jgi:hypothetical protein